MARRGPRLRPPVGRLLSVADGLGPGPRRHRPAARDRRHVEQQRQARAGVRARGGGRAARRRDGHDRGRRRDGAARAAAALGHGVHGLPPHAGPRGDRGGPGVRRRRHPRRLHVDADHGHDGAGDDGRPARRRRRRGRERDRPRAARGARRGGLPLHPARHLRPAHGSLRAQAAQPLRAPGGRRDRPPLGRAVAGRRLRHRRSRAGHVAGGRRGGPRPLPAWRSPAPT